MQEPTKGLKALAAAVLALAAGVLAWQLWPRSIAGADTLAQCLAEKKITMYGAEWCPHCQNQKRMFGDAFGMVSYVECPENAELCATKGIHGYPTWMMADGTRLEGSQRIERLAEWSGCNFHPAAP